MKRQNTDRHYHEQKIHAQIQDMQSLNQEMKEMRNPFAEYSSDLLVLNTQNVVDTAVADTMQMIKKLDIEQFKI